ncbi:MAG: rod-binding protein [Cyanobacteriota bacterium]
MLVNNDFISNNLDISKYQSTSKNIENLRGELNTENSQNKDKLMKAAQDFEAVFINQLLQVMDQTIERSEFMHGGQGEKIFRGMFYQEIAKEIASNPQGNFGLGKQIYDQLSKYE